MTNLCPSRLVSAHLWGQHLIDVEAATTPLAAEEAFFWTSLRVRSQRHFGSFENCVPPHLLFIISVARTGVGCSEAVIFYVPILFLCQGLSHMSHLGQSPAYPVEGKVFLRPGRWPVPSWPGALATCTEAGGPAFLFFKGLPEDSGSQWGQRIPDVEEAWGAFVLGKC